MISCKQTLIRNDGKQNERSLITKYNRNSNITIITCSEILKNKIFILKIPSQHRSKFSIFFLTHVHIFLFDIFSDQTECGPSVSIPVKNITANIYLEMDRKNHKFIGKKNVDITEINQTYLKLRKGLKQIIHFLTIKSAHFRKVFFQTVYCFLLTISCDHFDHDFLISIYRGPVSVDINVAWGDVWKVSKTVSEF